MVKFCFIYLLICGRFFTVMKRKLSGFDLLIFSLSEITSNMANGAEYKGMNINRKFSDLRMSGENYCGRRKLKLKSVFTAKVVLRYFLFINAKLKK